MMHSRRALKHDRKGIAIRKSTHRQGQRAPFTIVEQLEARRLLAGDGLRGQYFDNIDFTAPRVDRIDATVNFDWDYGAPAAGMGSDTFSVRWTGQVEAPATGTFTFYTQSDDGVRLWVHNQLIINNWTDHAPQEDAGSISLVAGQKYDIKLEYYERGNGAVAKLLWSGPGITKQIIPQSRLYSGNGPGEPEPVLPTVSIVANDPSASEAPGNPGQFTLTRTSDTSQPLTVSFTLGGTATNGVDYVSIPLTRTIPAGASSVTIDLSPIDDSIYEGSESAVLTLSPSASYNIGAAASATVTIADNDTPPTTGDGVYLSDLNWTSASSPYGGVKKDRANSGNPLRIGGVTYDKGLGVHSPSSITYNLAGQYTTFTAQVGVDDAVGDGSGDGNVVFEVWVDGVLKQSVQRTGADGAQLISVDVTGANELKLITTTNGSDYKDHANWADAKLLAGPVVARPTVGVYLERDRATEDGTGRGMFWIARDSGYDEPLTVNYVISGTATAGVDYEALPGSVTIPAGQGGVLVYVNALDDLIHEGTETVVLTLAPDPAYQIGQWNSATVSILDDDPAPVLPAVSISASDPAASETPGNPGQFTLSRSGSTDQPLVVNVSISGTATNGSDYTTLATSYTIPAGQSSITIDVLPINDSAYEGNETVTLTITANAAYIIGTASATVTIADNDSPPATGETVYLSDLNWTSATSPYGGVKKDRANSGNPLRIGGVTYDKGLGVHSPSSITYALNGQYTRFTAAVGIDDAVGNGSGDGSAVFEVWVDGVLKATSTRRTGAMGAELLDVDITGAQTLKLVTTTGGDNDYKDHADWADAKLHSVPTSGTPTISVTAQKATVTESAGSPAQYQFVFSRSGDLSQPLSVPFTLGGTATPGQDYQAADAVVTFAPGSATAFYGGAVIDDDVVEESETIIVTIQPGAEYAVGSPSSTTITILDDDAAQPVQHGLTAEYFNNPDFTSPVTTRIDPVLAMGNVSAPWDLPMADRDTFSVRWSGFIDPPETGTYQFTLNSNQGARVWVNGKLIIDGWEAARSGDTSLVNYNGNINLVAGQKVGIMVEYYELTGAEHIFLSWKRPGGTTETVPSDRLSPAEAPSGTPLKIIALGDSITEGEKGHASYRFWLDRMLKSTGVNFDFVGVRSGVHNSWVGGDNVPPLYPWFDQDHQSRWGAHLDELRQQVNQWAAAKPDIALIHIGHNDIRGGQSPQSLIDELALFIAQLRQVNPNIRIAIAQPVKNTSLGFVAEMDQYRALIPGLVASLTTAVSPIVVVDQYTGFDPATMTYDDVHPNEVGEKQIAERFYAAIQTLLAAGNA